MAKTLSREYKALIERFPLLPIKSKAMHGKAVAIMTELGMKDKLTEDESGYLVMLGHVIGDYERHLPNVQKFMNEVGKITAAEALKFLLDENGLSQSQLASELNMDPGNLSSFLSGKKGLSKANALKLAERFSVSVELFLHKE